MFKLMLVSLFRGRPSPGLVLTALLILWVWPLIGPALADSPPPPEADRCLDFAWVLYQEGDFFRASGEIKRFLFFHPGHPRIGEAERLMEMVEAAEAGRSDTVEEEPFRLGVALVRFYQNHFRTFKSSASGCPSYPNCSEYCLQALKKHGFLLGTFIQVDRFFREFTTVGQPPLVWGHGRWLHYDPLDMNDYWLDLEAKE